jgi:hypothetical protein
MFTPQLVRNRQSRRLYTALDTIAPQWPYHQRNQGANDNVRGSDGGSVGNRSSATAVADTTGEDDTSSGGGGGGGGGGGDDDGDVSGGGCGSSGGDSGRGKSEVSGSDDQCCSGGSDDANLGRLPNPNSIVVSQDRWCYYPPSLDQPQRQTNNPGAHLDICPWQYLPRADRRCASYTLTVTFDLLFSGLCVLVCGIALAHVLVHVRVRVRVLEIVRALVRAPESLVNWTRKCDFILFLFLF